jgi:hypothetical protein
LLKKSRSTIEVGVGSADVFETPRGPTAAISIFWYYRLRDADVALSLSFSLISSPACVEVDHGPDVLLLVCQYMLLTQL